VNIIKTAIRVFAVTILYFVCFAVISGALLAPASEQSAPAETGATLLALFLVSLINAAVWSYVIFRSRWTSGRLILTIFFIFFGVSTVMPQIESAYFITRLPPGMLPRLFLAGLIMAATFAPLAVLILGKAKRSTNETLPLRISPAKLLLIVVAYVLLYFTFGYFIAWKNPAVRAYYGGSDPAGFISHITSLVRSEPSLFLLQAVRALMWTAIAVPVIKMMKGEWWERGFAVALLFAVMTSQLLLPNPLMPDEVRMAHLLETATSNFLFGWLVVLILRGNSHGPSTL
jgi:hypothetical protein